jgi:pimeloyl-ACP methyl ester carboxylesterase
MPARSETISIPVDDQQIAGTFVASQAKNLPGVLFAHGWGGSQEQCLVPARLAAGRGCACLTFDFRGHGRTLDQRIQITREDSLRDIVAAYDVLASRPEVDPKAISIAGFSYGGYLAAIMTTLRPVSALALRAPAIYRDANWNLPKVKLHEDPELVLYRRHPVSWDDNRALLACVAFAGDVLILASGQDDVVPAPVSESYAAACTHARSLISHVIAGADHGLSDERWRREYTARLVDWLTKVMIKPRD